MSKIKVPEGMWEAAKKALLESPPSVYAERGASRICSEAALRWLSENPIVPTDEQIETEAIKQTGFYPNQSAKKEAFVLGAKWAFEHQRRVFLAPVPDPDEAIKDLLDPLDPNNRFLANQRILEAYRRGQQHAKGC